MAQRLMVARAIMHRPAVLFLDEPTAGLDPQSRLALWEILGELHTDGQTILLTTHYMEEADQLCERVAIMDHGRVLALDTPGRLKGSIDADTVVTIRVDGDRDVAKDRLAAEIEGVNRFREVDTDGVELHVTGLERIVPRIVAAAERSGIDIVDLSVAAPTLETVFINSDRKGAARLMAVTTTPAATDARTSGHHGPAIATAPTRSTFAASRIALAALARRDFAVLRKNWVEFVVRTLIQPFLLVFVFLYVFPSIGQGVGGAGGAAGQSAFATVLVPGVVGISIMFQGIQAVAMVLAQEFGFTREIEDRVQAPCPVWLVAVSKVLWGAVQGLLAALIVFPMAAVVHAPGVEAHLTVTWWIVLTLIPLTCIAMSSLGPAARLHVRGAEHGPDVRVRRAADHVPRWHLLPVDRARSHQDR